jgi:hypothetical protein
MKKIFSLMVAFITTIVSLAIAQTDSSVVVQTEARYFIKASAWKNNIFCGVNKEKISAQLGFHRNNYNTNAIYTNYCLLDPFDNVDEYIVFKLNYEILSGKNRLFIMPGIWYGLKGKTYYNIETMYLHQYNQKIGLYGSLIASEPKAVSAGLGAQWSGKKTVTSFAIFAGVDNGVGIPMAVLIRGRWDIWRGLFLEVEDIIQSRVYKHNNIEAVFDTSGNIVDHYETESLEIRLRQQQEVFLGISF